MGLVVWLPLTKDLRQQGLSNVTVTNNGATFNSAGKLGGCYKTSSSGYLDLGYNGNQINSSSLSFGGWFKFNQSEISSAISGKTYTSSAKAATGNLIGNNSYGGISLQWNSNDMYTSGSFNSMSVQSCLRTSTNGARATSSYTLPFDTWIHIFLTYDKDGNTLGLWINGELKYSYTQVAFTDAVSRNLILNWGAIAGGDGPSAYIPFMVNDIRIYDHCLSPMEVKELAKGLVLHYPLDRQGWGLDNLLINTHFDNQYQQTTGWDTSLNGTQLANSWDGYNGGVSNPSTGYHAHLYQFNNEWVYRYLNENGRWLGICQSSLQSKLTAGEVYTFSWEQYCVSGSNYATGGLYYYKTGATSANFHIGQFAGNSNRKTGQWQKFTYTFTAPSDGDYSKNMRWYVYGTSGGTGTFYFRHPKLEAGSIATPWTPATTDTLYSTMNINNSIEYDYSGFCNNGTRTGTFTWISDTPKYAVSQNCLGTNYIYLTPPSTEIQTMAVWVKWNTIPSGQSVILVDNGSGIGLGLYSGGILCSTSGAGSSYAFSKANLVANTWYHFVVVKTGATTRKLYINGVEQTANSNSSNWSYSVNQLQLGKRSTTSDGFVGKLSDFRAYATTLSADDVKSLYQNSAYIDSSGNVYGAVHSEV